MDKLIKKRIVFLIIISTLIVHILLVYLSEKNRMFLQITEYVQTVIIMLLIISLIIINNKLRYKNYNLENTLNTNTAMLDISEIAITTEDPDEVLDYILDKAIQVIGKSNKGSIMLLREDNYLEFIASNGFEEFNLKKSKLKLKDTFLYQESDENIDKPIIVEIEKFYKNRDIDDYEKVFEAAQIKGIKSTISAPILIDNKLYGMLNLDSEVSKAYDENDIKAIERFTKMIAIILKNHQILRQTIYQSKYDNLTDIYNRHSFEEIFKDVIHKAHNFKMRFSILIIDIDSLKYVNDVYGHLAGDELLKLFTNSIKEHIRCTDVFARYGGDEFVCILFNTDKETIKDKIKEVKDHLYNNPLIINEDKITCNFSYGISSYPEDATNHNDLIEIADKRMYEEKKNKKKIS